MNLHFLLLACVLCLCRSSASQEVMTVPLIDKTEATSPFRVSGRLLLRETVRGNQVEWSWGQKLAVKNVSDKPILLFAATLTEVGRHPRGKYAALGDGPTYQLDEDRFFSKELIRPGELLTLRDTEPGTPAVACCINPLAANVDPVAEFRLRFVQFADGTTFGDLAEARDALGMRDNALRGLRELNAVGDPAGFVAELEKKCTSLGNAICSRISAAREGGGANAAQAEARQILVIAKEHEAAIGKKTSN